MTFAITLMGGMCYTVLSCQPKSSEIKLYYFKVIMLSLDLKFAG